MLLCVVVLLGGFMAYAGATGQLTTLPGKVAYTIASPFQQGAAAVSRGWNSLWQRFVGYGETQRENAELHERIAELEQQLVDYDQYRAENEQLREFYGIREDNPEWETVPAFVTGRDPLASFYSFTIGEGSLKGIEVGNPVISSAGSLVGVVVDVGPNYARVKTILDPSMQAAAMVSRTRDSGLVGGDIELAGDGRCRLAQLSRESTATVGDRIITTGLGGAYPAELLVGTIVDIQADPAGASMYAVLEPTVDIETLRSVMVITSF